MKMLALMVSVILYTVGCMPYGQTPKPAKEKSGREPNIVKSKDGYQLMKSGDAFKGIAIKRESNYTGSEIDNTLDVDISNGVSTSEVLIFQYTVGGQIPAPVSGSRGVMALYNVKVRGVPVSTSCDGLVACPEAGLFNPNATRGSIAFRPTAAMIGPAGLGLDATAPMISFDLSSSDSEPSEPVSASDSNIVFKSRINVEVRAASLQPPAATCDGVALGQTIPNASLVSYSVQSASTEAACQQAAVAYTCQRSGASSAAYAKQASAQYASCEVIGLSLNVTGGTTLNQVNTGGTLNSPNVVNRAVRVCGEDRSCDEVFDVVSQLIVGDGDSRMSYAAADDCISQKVPQKGIKTYTLSNGAVTTTSDFGNQTQYMSCTGGNNLVLSYGQTGTQDEGKIIQKPSRVCSTLDSDSCVEAVVIQTHTFSELSFKSTSDCGTEFRQVTRDLDGLVTSDSNDPVLSCNQPVLRFSKATETVDASATSVTCDTSPYSITNSITDGVAGTPSSPDGYVSCEVTVPAGYSESVGDIDSPCSAKQVESYTVTLSNPATPTKPVAQPRFERCDNEPINVTLSISDSLSEGCSNENYSDKVSCEGAEYVWGAVVYGPIKSKASSNLSLVDLASGETLPSLIEATNAMVSEPIFDTTNNNYPFNVSPGTSASYSGARVLSVSLKKDRTSGEFPVTSNTLTFILRTPRVLKSDGTPGIVKAMKYSPTTGDLFIVGQFDMIGDVSSRNVARWDGTIWSKEEAPVGPDGSSINALDFASDGTLYITGQLSGQKSYSKRSPDGTWSTQTIENFLGVGAFGNAIAIDEASNGCTPTPCLYVGGVFTGIGTLTGSKNIARKKGDGTWTQLFGIGVNNTVNAIAVTPNKIYIGGDFTRINSTNSSNGTASTKIAYTSIGPAPSYFATQYALTGISNSVTSLVFSSYFSSIIANSGSAGLLYTCTLSSYTCTPLYSPNNGVISMAASASGALYVSGMGFIDRLDNTGVWSPSQTLIGLPVAMAVSSADLPVFAVDSNFASFTMDDESNSDFGIWNRSLTSSPLSYLGRYPTISP